jgi:hypothetical protein
MTEPTENEAHKTENAPRPSTMELGSMPLDPVYGWGLVFEPVETLIDETAAYIGQLAREVYESGEELSDEELEKRFLSFWDRLVAKGTLRRLPDRPPEFGRAILGPRRWLRAQRIRIQRLVAYRQEQNVRGAD